MSRIDTGRMLITAGYRCEYCRTTLVDFGWQVDHIVPRSRGGQHAMNNIAVACARCNRNKGDQVEARDPVSGQFVNIFDPRRDRWERHFLYGYTDRELLGRTPTGRATAALLFRTTGQHSPRDLRWEWIREIDDEAIYYFLNHQRVRRLSNKFADLELGLERADLLDRPTAAKDMTVANFALELLRLETLFTRSRQEDVRAGIHAVDRLLKAPGMTPEGNGALFGMRSILHQQLATIRALQGRHAEARACQVEAAKSHLISCSRLEKLDLSNRLRLATLLRKHDSAEESIYGPGDIRIAEQEAKEGQLRSVLYLADAELCRKSRGQSQEKVASIIDEMVQVCGYGQDFDYARGILLRRRWWAMKLLAGEKCDLDLLGTDISFWQSVNMHNEVRELTFSLQRLRPQVPNLRRSQIGEMLEVIRLRTQN